MSHEAWRDHSTNLVGIPTGLLASHVFNEYPMPLHISGVREMNPCLFEMLDQAAEPSQAADAFENYMTAVFTVDQVRAENGRERRRYRSSYRQLLEGWGFDANGPAGAVLKGWVESRFGLAPTYHKNPIRRVGSSTWSAYVDEKMASRYHNNSIQAQLDLLYEFCQWSLRKHFRHRRPHITLYRGVNDFAEHDIVEERSTKLAVIRMNNLVSFTSEPDIAGAFGDTILKTQVPATKILFFRELLPHHPLTGESEYLVLGGDYLVALNDL